jgi:hypothetical protein
VIKEGDVGDAVSNSDALDAPRAEPAVAVGARPGCYDRYHRYRAGRAKRNSTLSWS